ncbi:Uncharacterized protein TCM_033379 [Theobroma cacao]|uniref:Uncharacterized protein n=1 Tax=Theobroma cacao TaxID=3641 RepID=A0A061FBM0_THECC|nr:Uncharacterized protein TCM_033379 [Theobroma cacao]
MEDFSLPQLVSDLIDKDHGLSNLEGVEGKMHANVMQAIRGTPICQQGGKDKLVRQRTSDGSYTAKSTEDKDRLHYLKNFSTSDSIDEFFWNDIWKFPAQTKINNFF